VSLVRHGFSPFGTSPAAHPKGGDLFTISRALSDRLLPLHGEVKRFGLPAGGPGELYQALRFEVGEAMGEIALVVPQGARQLLMTGRHDALW
jgi:hypothetical protein